MKTRLIETCIAVALTLLPVAALAEKEAGAAPLKMRRVQVDAAHARALSECDQVFAVNACREKARTAHRNELKRLRDEELVLSDARRQARAERTGHKRASAWSEPVVVGALPESLEKSPPPPAIQGAGIGAAPTTTTVRKRKQDAASKRERFEAKQKDAAEHRARQERRNAERAGRKKADPLPTPPAASAP